MVVHLGAQGNRRNNLWLSDRRTPWILSVCEDRDRKGADRKLDMQMETMSHMERLEARRKPHYMGAL